MLESTSSVNYEGEVGNYISIVMIFKGAENFSILWRGKVKKKQNKKRGRKSRETGNPLKINLKILLPSSYGGIVYTFSSASTRHI